MCSVLIHQRTVSSTPFKKLSHFHKQQPFLMEKNTSHCLQTFPKFKGTQLVEAMRREGNQKSEGIWGFCSNKNHVSFSKQGSLKLLLLLQKWCKKRGAKNVENIKNWKFFCWVSVFIKIVFRSRDSGDSEGFSFFRWKMFHQKMETSETLKIAQCSLVFPFFSSDEEEAERGYKKSFIESRN